MTKLSDSIRAEIDGSEECRGRDAMYTEWIRRAEALELVAESHIKLHAELTQNRCSTLDRGGEHG